MSMTRFSRRSAIRSGSLVLTALVVVGLAATGASATV
jgi:hypothetical protein